MNFEHGRDTIVKTDKGLVRGFKHSGIYHFFGLDYAYADRYEVPRECDAWEGVKEATCFGYISLQQKLNSLGNHIKNPYRYWPESDHCQNLNVWTRDIDPTKKKPVVFWLHGGGYSDGSSIEHVAYDGYMLAKEQDLCVVTINHRLNNIGFLDLSSFGEEYKRTPNLGMLDIIEALKWVQRNIEQFGGDPNNVTIFGQSGGGGKVNTLMNMPAAEGLFHKAMIMSGVGETRGVEKVANDRPVILRALEIMGIKEDEVYKLKTCKHRELVNALKQAEKELKIRLALSPKRNEDYLGDCAVFGFSEYSKKVPLVVGSVYSEFNYQFSNNYQGSDTTDEEAMKLIDEKYGEGKAERLAPIFREVYPDLKLVDLLYFDINGHRAGSIEFAQKRIEYGCTAPTWNYVFAPLTKINEHSLPVHSYEIPFFFNNSALIPSNDLAGGYEVTKAVEMQCAGRFANFVRYGEPQLPGQVKWEPCTEGHIQALIIDRNTRLIDNYDEEIISIIRENREDDREAFWEMVHKLATREK